MRGTEELLQGSDLALLLCQFGTLFADSRLLCGELVSVLLDLLLLTCCHSFAFFDLPLLRFDLRLLLLEGVDKCDAQAVIFHALDFALLVVGDTQGR